MIHCGLVEPGSLVGANGLCAACFDRLSPLLLFDERVVVEGAGVGPRVVRIW